MEVKSAEDSQPKTGTLKNCEIRGCKDKMEYVNGRWRCSQHCLSRRHEQQAHAASVPPSLHL